MGADELMRKMSYDKVMGISDQNKALTAEEVLAAQKMAESRTMNRRHIATGQLQKTGSTLYTAKAGGS